jgi:uncharacterized membrane protein
MSSFAGYTVGALLLLTGIAYGMYLLGAPTQWIVVVILIAAGIRIMMGVGKTRPKDPPQR